MARKKRNPDKSPNLPAQSNVQASATAAAPAVPAISLSGEAGGAGIVWLLTLMMFLAPALGVPNEEMLQDTLKSIVVSFIALGAALAFLWRQRARREPLRWHAIVWLPLLLMAYALGSMAWSHTYLAGVEAIRWFIFALLLWLGANSLSREHLPVLAWGIHGGAIVASLWAALQFWIDFKLFPQGPHPASTFVNRNFFAEYAVCTLPFAAILLARARQSATVALLSFSSAFVIVAILMTGTRAALVSLWLQLLVLLPFIGWLYRDQFSFLKWPRGTQVLAAGVLLATVAGLGMIPTGDRHMVDEGRGTNALERGMRRTGSISPNDTSLNIRMVMWNATGTLMRDRPLSGVGAGAWENEIPRYQAEGSQLETDYYVHNEYLQLLAEYGIVGWVFLLALAAYLLDAFARTLSHRSREAREEAPWRAILLCSLLSLMVVSMIGFPWRMATTGALFALCLAALAASDARMGAAGRWRAMRLAWRPSFSSAGMALAVVSLALAAYITQAAAESEQKIVKATKIALTISASGQPNHPRWEKHKAQMLKLIREGVAINPHYRKVTPMVADELARWGDWENATWIWESVLSSRPHVVAILANVARGHLFVENYEKSFEYLERARQIQASAPSVRSLEVILLGRTGKEPQALALARQAIAQQQYDYDLANSAFLLGWRAGDYELAIEAMRLRMKSYPETRAEGYVKLGNMYASGMKDTVKALGAFRQAVALASETQHRELWPQIPEAYRSQLGTPTAPQPSTPSQTSASKG